MMNPATFDKTSDMVERIIPCARERFKKYGYRKTTVGEIAGDLRISKKTLYEVFPAKEALLKETVWRDMRASLAAFESAGGTGLHPDTLLLSFCRFVGNDRIKNGTDGRFWARYSDDADIRDAFKYAFRRVLAAVLEEGIRGGVFKTVRTDLAADVVIAILDAAEAMFTSGESPARLYNEALSMIADALAYHDRPPLDTVG